MKEFKTSLLREKFVIRDPHAVDEDGNPSKPTIALSNRVVADLTDNDGNTLERFIVRGHNMHTCLRMIARILYEYNRLGPLLERLHAFSWDDAWAQITNDFEASFNADRWIAVYAGGVPIYTDRKRHPFVDLIEKIDEGNTGEYETSVQIAEQAFKSKGKNLEISYDTNVAMNANISKKRAAFGIIFRGPRDTNTFQFFVKPNKKPLNMAQCVGAAAAFLEGIQLAFMVGMNTEKIRRGTIKRFTTEEKKTKEGEKRVIRLASEISNLENSYTVSYRPEKPDLYAIMAESEEIAKEMFFGAP